MIVFLIFCTFFVTSFATSFATSFYDICDEKDWWETAAFYQIYPRSFKDSDGDGIGDLNGVTEKLEHIKYLGIQATWLSPIFKSPMVDFGYDISDFRDIQPEYGTMADFDRMIRTAKDLNIKIILDFVPNHTSDKHKWFQQSQNRENGYEDYYVWHPGFPDPKNSSNRLPPSNWISVFRGSAWEYSSVRKEFYLHQFTVQQPDLNYRNPKVVAEMKSILQFWLDRGVSGFRVDAVPHLFEIATDEQNNYKDEPISGRTNDTDSYDYLNHIYTHDQNETLDMVYQWRDVLDDYKVKNGGETRIMLTESPSPIEIEMKYYGDGQRNGAHLPFNFHLFDINNDSMASDYKAAIDIWLKNMPEGRTANWVVGNHDQHRIATRLGTDHIDLINMIVTTLPGASVTYNGEEIGMTNVWISWNDTVDPAACNTNPTVYDQYSRDPERTPFQWDDSVSGGFSNSSKTWLPIAPNYKDVNVKVQRSAEKSHLKVFVDLIGLRNQQTLMYGDVFYDTISPFVFIIIRFLENAPSYATIVNIGHWRETIDISNFKQLTGRLQYAVVSVNSNKQIGDFVNDNTAIVLMGHESIVLVSEPQFSSEPFTVHLIVN